MELSAQHPSIRYVREIQQICHPLFSNTKIIYFVYIRIFNSGHVMTLPSNVEWHSYYFKKGYYKNCRVRSTPGMKLWSANKNFSQALVDSKQLFGIDNKFEIATVTDKYTEVFGWGGQSGDISIIEFYLNNISTLMSFGYYFKEKAINIIKEANKPHNLIATHPASSINDNQPNSLKHYLEDNTKRYYITDGFINNETYLTKREIQTLLLTIQGKNSKDISKKLGISDATVRTYLESVRIKTNSTNKEELIINANKLNILKLID